MEEGQRTMMTTGKSAILFLSSIGVLQGANALARVHFPIRLSRPNSVAKRQSQTQYTFCLATDSDLSNEGEPEDDLKSVEISSVRIDDGGSDLTDRFKYKVNALMGVFDPQGEDDERQDGNILNAMLRFPVRYSFNVVGKTNGNEAMREEFVKQVKSIVGEATGDIDGMECQIIPRGENFTKITVEAMVENAAMISTTYGELEELEFTIMRF